MRPQLAFVEAQKKLQPQILHLRAHSKVCTRTFAFVARIDENKGDNRRLLTCARASFAVRSAYAAHLNAAAPRTRRTAPRANRAPKYMSKRAACIRGERLSSEPHARWLAACACAAERARVCARDR